MKKNFIATAEPTGVAVVGGHIYWGRAANSGAAAATIGRANLDGTAVNQRFITGASNPGGCCGFDSKHIYWANDGPNLLTGAGGSIGRANLDGTGVNQHFIKTPHVTTVAVASGHLYWTEGLGAAASSWIGRSNLDGTHINSKFIHVEGDAFGLATG